jgi:antitoxin ParD1/3/4
MNVSLTPELERLVNEKVESGLYQTASEVVREALRLLKERDQARQQLRADVQAGFDQLARGDRRLHDDTSGPCPRDPRVSVTASSEYHLRFPTAAFAASRRSR